MNQAQRNWQANPQAMAAVSKRSFIEPHPELSVIQDGDTWLTPRWILDRLGKFDLDPCAADGNPFWVAATSLTKGDNGLECDWYGRVFMNPPFSDTRPWLEKHACHREGISLVPASVESIVWRKHVWTRANSVYILHGRTRFANPDGSSTTGRPLRSIALISWTAEDTSIVTDAGFAGVLLSTWKQT